jgi:hypothetical protein
MLPFLARSMGAEGEARGDGGWLTSPLAPLPQRERGMSLLVASAALTDVDAESPLLRSSPLPRPQRGSGRGLGWGW